MSKTTPDNDGLPSYDDATAEPLSPALFGPGLVTEVEFQRQELVRAAIERHVLPVLRRQAKYGLARSVTVLEPHEPAAYGFEKSGSTRPGELISPADENMTVAQLEGDQNSAEFWRQPSVVQEVKHQLSVILCASTVFQGVEFKRQERPAAERQQSSSSWRAWGKKPANGSEIALAHPAKNSDGLELSVDIEDIVRRTQNDFSLYETVTTPALVIRVVVEC